MLFIFFKETADHLHHPFDRIINDREKTQKYGTDDTQDRAYCSGAQARPEVGILRTRMCRPAKIEEQTSHLFTVTDQGLKYVAIIP